MGMESLQFVKNSENKQAKQEAPAFECEVKLHCLPMEEEKETTFRTIKLKFEMFI